MRYEIINDNNDIINTILADPDFVESAYPGKYRLVEESTSDPKKTVFSKLEFQLLFTFDELVAIELAAETDPGVRVLQKQQQVADVTDINHESTQLGIMYLVSKGLITHARGVEILGI